MLPNRGQPAKPGLTGGDRGPGRAPALIHKAHVLAGRDSGWPAHCREGSEPATNRRTAAGTFSTKTKGRGFPRPLQRTRTAAFDRLIPPYGTGGGRSDGVQTDITLSLDSMRVALLMNLPPAELLST